MNYKENILIVLNRIPIENFNISGENVEYILILDTSEHQAILRTICTITQSGFDINEYTEGDYINIAPLGFEFGECWSYSEGFGQFKTRRRIKAENEQEAKQETIDKLYEETNHIMDIEIIDIEAY